MKNLITLIQFLLLLMVSQILMAQPGLPVTPTQAPIDGGLGLLAAAGGAYAIKKMRERNMNQDTGQDLNSDV